MKTSTFFKNTFKNLVLFVLLSIPAQAQGVNPLLADKLKTTLGQQQAKHKLIGVAAAVVIPGQGIWSHAIGNSTQSQPLTTNMIFGIGSVTKTYTAAVIHQLAEEGRLSLNDSLFKHLPAIDNIDSTIQVRQLLDYTSGIFNYTTHPDWGVAVENDFYKIWERRKSPRLLSINRFLKRAPAGAIPIRITCCSA